MTGTAETPTKDNLRLWAYQWVTRGEIPDLPEDVKLIRTENIVSRVDIPIIGYGFMHIDLNQFVVKDGMITMTAWIGYGGMGHRKWLAVTPTKIEADFELEKYQ